MAGEPDADRQEREREVDGHEADRQRRLEPHQRERDHSRDHDPDDVTDP